MSAGHFIVLEGVDGAGTTTHTRILSKALEERGVRVKTTREPSDGPIGAFVRQIITGRVVGAGGRAPSWSTMALLFAADRLDHVDSEITPQLADGVTVLSDRYDHSSVAYQSLTGGGGDEFVHWVATLNRYARRPDLTIVLDVPAEVARARRIARHAPADLYDDDALQARLVSFYREIDRHFPREKIVHVDSNRELDAVKQDIVKAVVALSAPRS